MKRFKTYIIAIFIALILCQCVKNTDIGDSERKGETVAGRGPGGSCIFVGKIRAIRLVGRRSKSFNPENTRISLHQSKGDRYEEIAWTLVDSSDGSFKIIDIPVGTYDMIVRKSDCLSRKLSHIVLKPGETSIKDYRESEGISSVETFVIKSQNYDHTPRQLLIGFKENTLEKEIQRVISSSGCTVEKTLDSLSYWLIIPETTSIAHMIDYFIEIESVRYATPNYYIYMD
jgi:hypothetical protein